MSARSSSKKKSKPVPVQSSSSSPRATRSPSVKPRSDVYTVMTILAFLGIVAATVLVYLEWSKLSG